MIDLFEDYENIPNDIQDILDKYSEDFEDGNYEGLSMALQEVRDRGYTFEYYVNGDAYGLRPIGVPLNELEGYEDEFSEDKNQYAGGGGVDWYDFDKKMALINLNQINEYAIKLDNIVTEDTELEEWVKMKLTRVEQNIADIKHSLSGWEKFEEFGDGGRIFKKQLLHIAKYSKDLIAMIKLGSKLMSWQENKLAISADYIDGIYHHLDYIRKTDLDKLDEYLGYANGGGVGNIPNNYEGKSPKDIWDSWSKEQRYHFLTDPFFITSAVVPPRMIEHPAFSREGELSFEQLQDISKLSFDKLNSSTFEQYKNKIHRELLSLGLDKEDAKFVISFKGNQKYISDMYVGEKNYKSTAKELYEQSNFQVGLMKNGGGIKTDFNELENTELRNVLISFWNDFFNNHIGNYLSIEKENYILSNIDNVFVIVRNEDKGNFSDVEKQNIDRFLSPYFDSDKKPLFTDFFNSYEIKDNKIIIYIKNMYANGGGVKFERVTSMEDAVVSFLTKSNNFNYTNVSVNHSQGVSFLFQYGTLIAKKDGNNVFISDKKYSATTSKLQNLIKSIAQTKGFKVMETEFFDEGGGLDKMKIGKYQINTETFEVSDENGDIVYTGRTLLKAKKWANDTSKYDKDVVFEDNSLEITKDALGNLHFDFDRRRNTGWAFDTDDVGVAVAIITGSSFAKEEAIRNIEINSRQLRDSDRKQIVYWLSGGNKEWRFGETYNKSFDETYDEIFDDVALQIKKLMQKEKTIGGLIDLFKKYNTDYFIDYAQREGSWGEYVFDEDYEREKEMDEELVKYEDGEDYAKEYILDNYNYKSREEILNDLINHFEQEDIEYDEDRINDIIKETFESVDKQTLSLFRHGGGVEISKIQLENMVGKKLNGWNDDVVYYNGKKYQKCYLRPYYKVC